MFENFSTENEFHKNDLKIETETKFTDESSESKRQDLHCFELSCLSCCKGPWACFLLHTGFRLVCTGVSFLDKYLKTSTEVNRFNGAFTLLVTHAGHRRYSSGNGVYVGYLRFPTVSIANVCHGQGDQIVRVFYWEIVYFWYFLKITEVA